MSRAPDVIARQFPIAPEAGQQARAIPRALLGYSGPNKARFLATQFAMIMAGSLPEHGQKRTWRPGDQQQARQRDLALSAGLKARETFTRWLSEIATPDDSWDVPRRLEQRQRTRELHQRRGHQLHDRERPVREHLDTLIHRRRRFMKPNHYEPAYGHINPRRPAEWFPPRPSDLEGNELLQRRFNRVSADGKWWEGLRDGKEPGSKAIGRWLWDPNLPLSWTARLVMTFYFLCGLGSKDRDTGKITGTIQPSQLTVATALGFGRKTPCTRTVYNANRELARLGLIRVAHERIRQQDGSYRTGNQIIVYLPIRYLSEEEAAEERSRLEAMDRWRQFGLQQDRNAWMASRVKELHATRLAAYMREEHQHPTSLGTFWRAVRTSAIAEGIHLSVINSLIPSPPE